MAELLHSEKAEVMVSFSNHLRVTGAEGAWTVRALTAELG